MKYNSYLVCGCGAKIMCVNSFYLLVDWSTSHYQIIVVGVGKKKEVNIQEGLFSVTLEARNSLV